MLRDDGVIEEGGCGSVEFEGLEQRKAAMGGARRTADRTSVWQILHAGVAHRNLSGTLVFISRQSTWPGIRRVRNFCVDTCNGTAEKLALEHSRRGNCSRDTVYLQSTPSVDAGHKFRGGIVICRTNPYPFTPSEPPLTYGEPFFTLFTSCARRKSWKMTSKPRQSSFLAQKASPVTFYYCRTADALHEATFWLSQTGREWDLEMKSTPANRMA